MRYIVQYVGHMPKCHRHCVARVKIEPGFNGRPIEVYDGQYSINYHPNKRAAMQVQRTLTINANHPIYDLDDLGRVKDEDVSEWLHDSDRLINIENHEAWFEALDDERKTLLRIEFLEHKLNAIRMLNPKSLDLGALASVIDMANSHIEDIQSGLEDGTYEKQDNVDIDDKIKALNKVRGYLAASPQP